MSSRIGKYFFMSARLVLGALFIVASIDKIAHPLEFARIVSNYRILPGAMVNIIAVVLPWLEVILGLLLLCGWWLPGAAVVANLLLLVFLGALAQASVRGIDLHCGCFSTKVSGAPQTAWYFVRDILFLLPGGAVLIQVMKKY